MESLELWPLWDHLTCDPGACLTNNIVLSQSLYKTFVLLKYDYWLPDSSKFMHMPGQHNLHGMYKVL